MISLSALTQLTAYALSQHLYPDIPFLNVGNLSGEPGRTLRDGRESGHEHEGEHTQATAPNVAFHTFHPGRCIIGRIFFVSIVIS